MEDKHLLRRIASYDSVYGQPTIAINRLSMLRDAVEKLGAAALVIEFLNTHAIDAGTDSIASPSELHAWLMSHGLAHTHDQMSLEDVARAVDLREALRELIGLNTGGRFPIGAAEALNRTAGASLLRVSVSSAGDVRLDSARGSPLERAGGAILAAVYRAVTDGSWSRMKLCKNPRCRWAFYDRSKNRSGGWCTMAICGNRAKARTFRARRRLRQQQI
jgi:predicted RNA-binding Zn ribbon-like protein